MTAKATRDTQHVLITGGAGFIGSHLTDRLLSECARVTVVDDLSTETLAISPTPNENQDSISSTGGFRIAPNWNPSSRK
jgi:nucleoside-diphosphate-sugar epimerase